MGWTRSKSINTGKHSEMETFTGASLPAPWGSNTNSTGIVQTDIDANRTLVTDQAGKQRISKTSALGQLTDVWEVTAQDSSTVGVTFPNTSIAYGYQTSYQYDTLNNLKQVNQGSQTRTFTYSTLSRLLSATNPESGAISYVYDNNGNLTSKTDARSVVTAYTYDELNRVKTRSYSGETGYTTPTVTYTYNTKGQLTTVANSYSTTEYTQFDILGRATKSKQTTDGTAYNEMEYTFNLSGALVEQKYPSGRVVKNVLDNDGQLSIVQSKKNANSGFWNYADSFTYTAAGAVSSMQLGNGKWESTKFNARLQPTEITLNTVLGGTDKKLNLVFDYGTTNNNGNVLSQTITVPTTGGAQGFTAVQTYNYDSLNRLKSAEETISSTTSWKQTFTFDRYGNRRFDEANTDTLASGCATAVCNPTIDPATNKLIGYVFDTAGNTKTDAQNRTFTYDGENKQIEVKDSSNYTIGKYFYDGDGKRVKKIEFTSNTPVQTTIFIYDASGKMIAEYETEVAPVSTAQVSYLTSDHLGSPRITTDKDGKVFSRRDFMPFGEEITSEHTPERDTNLNYGEDGIRQKFTTYERDDETDLDFAQARMYANKLGRFSSSDPLQASASAIRPQSWSRYSYSYNNPLRFTDPSGMIAGDFFDREGYWIGNDGENDGKVYLLNKGKSRKREDKTLDKEQAEAFKKDSTEVGGIIVIEREEEGEDYTIGEFWTNGRKTEKDVSGFTLEPEGPDTTTPNQDKRVPEGVYDLNEHSGTKFKNTFVISNENVSKDRAIVFHAGNSGSDTEGCIMFGGTKSNGTIGNSKNKTNEVRSFIESAGASNVKLIIRNRIHN